MIRDLQAQIESVKQRAQAKELKESPAMKRTITIMRSIHKAIEEAGQEKNSALQRALTEAREPVAAYMDSQGMQPPRARKRRARRSRA